MDARPNPDRASALPWAGLSGLAVAATALLWFFPLWRVVPLAAPVPAASNAFNAAEFAARYWADTLSPARSRAVEAGVLAAALRRDPAEAARRHARTVGLGTAYYFVRGSGRIVAVERNALVLALEGGDGATFALETGPIFGNTVRDGPALLNVNDFPSLTDFNAVSAELNHLVEDRVLPELRKRAVVGASIEFTGCAEAADPVAGQPLLTLIPVFAEVRPTR